MVPPVPPGLPYHRLARTAAHRWWRPWLGLIFVAGCWVVLVVVAFGVALAIGAAAGQPVDRYGLPVLGTLGDLALMLVIIAGLLPLVLVAARAVQGRPSGSLSSVTGRVRWRWLLRCLLPALAVPVLSIGGALVIGVDAGAGSPGGWPGWGSFLAGSALVLLLVPVQAAAEEYAFRGYLLQALGTLLRRPWLPIAVQAALFAAVHGWGTAAGFADLVVFGVLTGYLTVRTGGIEAAVALHVANNLVAFLLAAGFGQLAADETAADMPWQMVAIDVPALIAYTLVVVWLARRKRIARRSPDGPDRPALAGGTAGPAASPATITRWDQASTS